MERKIVISFLFIQYGILFQAVGILSESTSASPSDHHFRKKRIIGASHNRDESVLNQIVPYVVLLVRESGQVLCTGSILTSRIIITAAHCVINTRYFVESGGTRSGDVKKHNVLTKTIHDDFDEHLKKNDLALFVIKEPIDLINTHHRAINLYEGNLPINSQGTVSGWGLTTKKDPPELPSQAGSIKVTIISLEQCKHAYNYRKPLTSHEICTYYQGRTKCCWFGDSGGPLVVQNRLVGILSWFSINDAPQLPDVFMNLSNHDYNMWVQIWIKYYRAIYPH